MINKNFFSAVLVSIFVLSVFSFLSGNVLAEETCGNGVCDIGEETTYNCPNGNINLIVDGKRYENLVLGARAWITGAPVGHPELIK